ncbi:succinic semialdehyde dehydrogenase [Amycolatopsis acididurans]|uniref:succinic semialdehyde dehydrogenase n=1 Tax=Amycolatopsis acididurans TaxID=2724524 RepID=UPI0028A8B121|nr:succinic semialdehyde dehydrogenase [Amycolatopsis acididurans]
MTAVVSRIRDRLAPAPEDVGPATRRAREAQPAWAARPVRQRAAIALRFHDLLLENEDEILDLLQWEVGKARIHALQEVAAVAGVARHYGRRAAHYLRDRRRRGAVPLLTHVTEVRHPKGVVGIVGPWNYPLFLSIGDALPALLAGNAVVIKADEKTPLSVLWAAELLARAGLPPGLLHVVTGDGPVVGAALIDQVDYVCFTGSTRTGRVVGKQAAGRLIGCSLELGGKNPMIVRADADLDRAVEGAVQACFSNGGQLCLSVERIYVHERIAEEFTRRFADRAARMRLGAHYDYTDDMGPLVSQRHLRTVEEHVEDARRKGATVRAGGRARPDISPLCYEPTVLTGVTAEMTVHAEETFGPVVSVYPVSSDEQAVALANSGSYGLSASVWTKDTERGRALARRIIAGAVNVNDGFGAAIGSVDALMGGMRESGVGRRHGAEGMLKYTEAQTIAVQRLVPMPPQPGVGLARNATLINASLAMMRRLRLR